MGGASRKGRAHYGHAEERMFCRILNAVSGWRGEDYTKRYYFMVQTYLRVTSGTRSVRRIHHSQPNYILPSSKLYSHTTHSLPSVSHSNYRSSYSLLE